MAEAIVGGAASGARTSDGYRRLVLAMLVAAYTFNFIDRTVVATIGQAIKVDLRITDTQLGLLGGFSFAVLYTFLGIPIARAAERMNRVSIIALAMVVWSGFTVACGFAAGFLALLALRVGVGVGEAGCSPPAHSLISDYFEPRKRASALAVYSFGIPLGAMIGAVAGGWLAETYGWRVAFMVVGAPGVIAAVLLKGLVREPPRGLSDATRAAPAAPPIGFGSELRELAAVARVLFGSWPILNLVLGSTLAAFAGYGVGAFGAPYFIRAFGLDYATVGLVFGLASGVSNGIGTLAGGVIADRLGRAGDRWYALVPAIGIAAGAPIWIAIYLVGDWRLAAVISLATGVFASAWLGPTLGVVQNVVEPRRRATASALLWFFLNLIALGGGPVFVGWMIDRFAAFHFANPGVRGLLAALASLIHVAPVSFAHLCPGGLAPPGAGAATQAACQGALVLATRQGIVIGVLFSVWAALHYLLGSFGLARRMAEARGR